ncbi:hypothetical protein D3C85_903150 [compost metagenome]
MLHAGHGRSRRVERRRFRLPIEGAEQVVHQRENDVEITRLHQFTAVVQFVQPAHLADPRQPCERVARRQMLAGMKHFISQVAEDKKAADQSGDVGIDVLEQPPEGQGDGEGVQHDQPRRKQNHPPVAGAVVGHVAGGEKAVVVDCVTGIKQPGEALFMMPQVAMHHVHTEVEQQQRDGHRQPFRWPHLMYVAPEDADSHCPEHQDKRAVQPGVVERMNVGAVTAAESFGGLPHCNHLSFLLSLSD